MAWFDLRGAVNVRDFGAEGTGDRDDGPSIQAAIDSVGPAGGTIFIPEGTYCIGTPTGDPAGTGNGPVQVGSNVRIIGAGPRRTILRLAKNVRQNAPNGYYRDLGASAAVVINRGNAWWHTGWRPELTAPPADEDILISSMTIDGNKDGQPAIYERGNRTNGRIPDPVPLLSGVGASVAGAGDGPFPSSFLVSVTFATSAGRETGATSASGSIAVGADQNAIELTLPPTPTRAEKLFVYLATEQDDQLNWNFRRAGPFCIPSDRKLIVRLSLWSTLAARTPPDTLRFPVGAASGIFFSNVRRCVLMDLEIANCVEDGLRVQGTVASDHLRAERLHIHHNRRWGLTLDGPTRDVRFIDCSFDDNSAGADVGEAGEDIHDLSFAGCRFRNNAVFVSPLGLRTVYNLEFNACHFESPAWCAGALRFANQRGRMLGTRITACTFRDFKGVAVVTGAPGDGIIKDCDFLENGSIPSVAVVSQLMFQDPGEPTTWTLSGNRFRPPKDGDNWPVIQIAGVHNRMQIHDNRLEATAEAQTPILFQLDDGSPESNHSVGWNPGS